MMSIWLQMCCQYVANMIPNCNTFILSFSLHIIYKSIIEEYIYIFVLIQTFIQTLFCHWIFRFGSHKFKTTVIYLAALWYPFCQWFPPFCHSFIFKKKPIETDMVLIDTMCTVYQTLGFHCIHYILLYPMHCIQQFRIKSKTTQKPNSATSQNPTQQQVRNPTLKPNFKTQLFNNLKPYKNTCIIYYYGQPINSKHQQTKTNTN